MKRVQTKIALQGQSRWDNPCWAWSIGAESRDGTSFVQEERTKKVAEKKVAEKKLAEKKLAEKKDNRGMVSRRTCDGLFATTF